MHAGTFRISFRNMSYSESAEGVTISHARALSELAAHGIDVTLDDDGAMTQEVAEFYRDCGCEDTYQASAVLAWLGY